MNNNDKNIVLIGNNFSNNSGVQGGAINLKNCLKGIVASNIFSKNFAKSGGAFFYNSSSIYLFLVNSKLLNFPRNLQINKQSIFE